jgi:hypothetical protein
VQPDPFKGPFLPDLALSLIGIPLGNLVGFWIGVVMREFRKISMAEYILWSGGILGTFTVWLVLWSRIS